jgi:hypothetical protein
MDILIQMKVVVERTWLTMMLWVRGEEWPCLSSYCGGIQVSGIVYAGHLYGRGTGVGHAKMEGMHRFPRPHSFPP